MSPRRLTATRLAAMLLCFVAAALLVYASRFPYWEMRLKAPQYPEGLTLRVFIDRVEGDVDEVNTLNHYIGVGKIEEGAKLERAIAYPAIGILAGALLLAPFAGRRKLAVLAIPAIGFPAIFVLDLAYWMHRLSTDLDPTAPIKMKAFSFALSGDTKIAQFSSHTSFAVGFGIAVLAAIAALAAVVLREVFTCPGCPHRARCGLVCKGALPWSRSS